MNSTWEHAFMREREYFEALCNTGDGVFIVDKNKHVVHWNKEAERILQFPQSEATSQECHRLIAGKTSFEKIHCDSNCKIHSSVLKGLPQKNFDLLTTTRAGEPVWLNISVILILDGTEPFLAHVIRDITRSKRTELALNRFLTDLGTRGKMPAEKPAPKDRAAARSQSLDKPSASLSDREIEVLTLLAEGLPTKGLAQRLDISHFTARNHIQNILVKLGLHSKAQAVSYAFKKGIL
jgi:PAS domain S-box-containing protein